MLCAHMYNQTYSAVILVKINREQRRERGYLLTKERREAADWLTCPGRSRSYAAQTMLDAEWQ